MEDKLAKIGVRKADILYPKEGIDMTKWAVVACDQYTSQPDYWNKVEEFVGDSPSTLRLVLPEIYLNQRQEMCVKINENIRQYIDEGILEEYKSSFVLVDRDINTGKNRKGLMLAVDLDSYDYKVGSKALIRATEGTVIDRLPPRMEIRQNAPIELPHIMLLIDDENNSVIEPALAQKDKLKKIYDFDLMMDSGHIAGYMVDDKEIENQITDALYNLKNTSIDNDSPFIFAVGDGNHSLASAKGHWENIKKTLKPEEIENHPAKYALVEVVNIHDESLEFEPIHRVLFNTNRQDLFKFMQEFYGSDSFSVEECKNIDEMYAKMNSLSGHTLGFVDDGQFGVINILRPLHNIAVGTLQKALDKYIEDNSNVEIDYIHGDDVVVDLAKGGDMGFFIPTIEKKQLFETIVLDGVLPRKTFSMGEAFQKRFYLESRKIR